MKSKMSFCNPTLLKKNLSRFSPVWAGLVILLFLTGPLFLLRSLGESGSSRELEEIAESYFSRFGFRGLFPAFLLAILCAGLPFKYLHKTNAAYMMHAFPMTRTCMFLTNAFAGFLLYAVPVLINALAYQTILLCSGVRSCSGPLWNGVLTWILEFLFFYGLAVFCMVLSGNSIISVLSYAALNFIGYLLPLLLIIATKLYYYGLDITVSRELTTLSPLLRIVYQSGDCIGLIWIYAGVGLVLLVLAWLHNRQRHVERAGDAMAYGWARVAFRVIFTLCCAIGFGMVLSLIFSYIRSDNGPRGGVFLLYTLIGCFVGWFASSMMLERTVKVFRNKKIWIGFGAFAAAIALFILGTRYDILGFQRRIPDASGVESVEIWTQGSDIFGRIDPLRETDDVVTLREAKDIEAIRAIHANALKIREKELQPDAQGRIRSEYDCYEELHIRYHLKSGGTLSRVYHVTRQSDYETVRTIYSRPDLAEEYYRRAVPDDFVAATVYGLDKFEEFETVEGEEPVYWDGERSCAYPAALKAAILEDAAAGRLPILNSFTNTDTEPTFWVYFTLREAPYTMSTVSIQITATAEKTLSLFPAKDPNVIYR